MQGDLDYADALKILGEGNYKTLDALDRIFGGAILVTSAATSQIGFLGLLEARNELIRYSRRLLARIGQRVRGATGKGRTDLLMAAHAVVAVNGFFEALRTARLPINWQSMKLSGAEKLMLAGSSSDESAKLVDAILRLPLPTPTPSKPYEAVISEIQLWYLAMSQRTLEFMKGLAVWDSLSEKQQSTLEDSLLAKVPATAVLRYEEAFRRLAVECPEFKMWIYLTDSAASRAAIETLGGNIEIGLAGLQKVLESLAAGRQSAEWPMQLSRAYIAQLDRPIAETSPGEALAGLVVPTLGTGYINPRLRVAEYGPNASPAEEGWWSNVILSDDVQWFLAGYLTSPAATEAPLVILGQPGSGKSLLTKILAARLPPDEYLPVRVELRHVPADAPIQDQIEFALREATHERMDWPELLRQAGDALTVVMLDGFDELLQSTGLSHSGYLEQVRNFQRGEIAQGRRVAFIVTSRTIVANRIRFPEGTLIAKMEPFNEGQIKDWINAWNSANAEYFRRAKLQSLAASTVLSQRDLAEQPLLLLMLSFYDADGNALQQHSDELARADLYEGLLTKFVDREIDKGNTDLAPDEKQVLADAEMDELSVVAFAMFNRSRKSVSEEDLDIDLGQLLPYDVPGSAASRMARRLSRAQLAVGRFFFIHRSQAVLDDVRMNDYEFLHATFGEYLVARLVHKILAHFISLSKTDKPSRAVRSTSVIDDSRLWDLLSFAPLTDGSQTVTFLSEVIRKFDPEPQADLRVILTSLFRRSLGARERGYRGYEPRPSSVPVRHAVYSANLVVLNVCASSDGILHASTLFGSHARVVDAWRSYALLWKSQFDSADWDGLINSLNIKQIIQDTHDLAISYEPVRLTKPIEHFETVNWMVQGTEESQDSGIGADKAGWQAIFLCAPELDMLVHALQPLLRISPRAFRELIVNPEGNARSAMNMILSALITAAEAGDESAGSRHLATSWLTRYSSRFDNLLLTSTLTTGVWGRGSKSVSNVTLLPPALYQASNVIWDSNALAGVLTTNMDEVDREVDEFALLRLCVSSYSGLSELSESLPELGNLSRIYSKVNPIALASEDSSFVAGVLKVARLYDLRDWAALQGLAVLVVLDSDKLATQSREDVEFVLTSSASDPAQMRLAALIRDRYDGAVH